jgi:phenylpropionate dioxygenase-like ring-hydroxylating dioxygenase large terminal subunit
MAVIDRSTAVLPYAVTNPERIPKSRYFDEEFFELERELFWPHVWQFACRMEEIDDVGDWMEYRNLDLSVLVVRTGPDEVKAFDNACRHRGAQLGVGRGNCASSGFTCPFHGWCYDIHGTNTHVYRDNLFSESQLERGEINLRQYRTEVWGGSVFVNQDPDALPLRDHLGVLPDLLDARNMGEMKTVLWRSVELPCNWKLTLEAFFESYHLRQTHPQLLSHGRVDTYGTEGASSNYGSFSNAKKTNPVELSREQWIENQIGYMHLLTQGTGMVMSKDVDVARSLRDLPLPDEPAARTAAWERALKGAITDWGHSVGIRTLPDLNALPQLPHMVFFAFPNYHMVPAYGNAALSRVRPLTPETCLYELFRITHAAETAEHEPVRAPTYTPIDDSEWGLVLRQDFSNLPLQQDGVHRRGFEYMRLSREVEGRISLLHQTIDTYLAARPSGVIARAASLACGQSDVPVMDLALLS